MPTPPRPPGIQSIFDELATGIPFDSIKAANQHIARRMRDYNHQPQPELGGLSPDQVGQLLEGDWTGTGALRLASDAPLELLRDVPMLADARRLLGYVAEQGCSMATDATPTSGIEPLVKFGLLERRLLQGKERWTKHPEYRRTALFGRMLRFQFRGEWRGAAVGSELCSDPTYPPSPRIGVRAVL